MSRKGKLACYKQSLLYSQCFPQYFLRVHKKGGLVWEWVKGSNQSNFRPVQYERSCRRHFKVCV